MKVLAIALSILLIPVGFAWTSETHIWLCEQLYDHNNDLRGLVNKKEFLEGCTAPDIVFKDFNNHHCYIAKECSPINISKKAPATLLYFSDLEKCKESSNFDCPALEKFQEYVTKNTSFDIGASVHYLSDAYVPVHQTMGEDYFSCHQPFEEKVENNIKSRSWVVSQECEVYFPCYKAKTAPRKCDNGYSVTVIFSYSDMVDVLKNMDSELSKVMSINTGDYSNLTGRSATGFFTMIMNKIKLILAKVFHF